MKTLKYNLPKYRLDDNVIVEDTFNIVIGRIVSIERTDKGLNKDWLYGIETKEKSHPYRFWLWEEELKVLDK